MAQTKAQIRNRALRKLGKLALGSTPQGDLADDMEDAYDQVYTRLRARGLVTWSATDDVPDEFVEDIVALMSFERSEGVPNERYARIRDDARRAVVNISATLSTWSDTQLYKDY